MSEARELAKQRIIRMEQELKSLEQELAETHAMNLCDKIRSLKNAIAWVRHNDHIPEQYPTDVADPENYAVVYKIKRGSPYKCTRHCGRMARITMRTHDNPDAHWFNKNTEIMLCGKCLKEHNERVEASS